MLQPGSKAPAFSLRSCDDEEVSLRGLAGRYVVLYFYPKDDTPGCTVEARDFRDALPELARLGAVVLGVSRDSAASHCRFRDKHGLTFPLLTDAEATTMTAYGAWGEKVMYGKKVVGVIRSTALIGPDGTVVAHWPKVKVDGHVAQVLEALRAHAGGAPTKTRPAPAPKARPAPKAKPAPAAKAKPAPKARPAPAAKAKPAPTRRAPR